MLWNSAISANVISLPESVKTRGGYSYCPIDDMWAIPDASRKRFFNFGVLSQYCCDELLQSLKKTMIWYLRERSTAHANNMFNQFKYFLESVKQSEKISAVTSNHIMSYKGNLPKENSWYLGALAGFIKQWHELGYFGIESDAYALLKELRIKGNRKGWAVLTFDPEEGPFDEIELQSIYQAINTAYAKGEIDNREFSLAWLFMATGARPVQIAGLKISDFMSTSEGGSPTYYINIPRAKQRGSVRRSSFKTRPLVAEIGVVLDAWITQVKMNYSTTIQDSLRVNESELPIFPSWHVDSNPDFRHHSDGDILSREIHSLFNSLDVQSHRTRQKMRVTPQRFRYTIGTRAAMEKNSPMVIAEILDQSDTQNVHVYVKCVPEIIEHLDKALAMELAPFADAFAGKIVTDDNAKYNDDPTRLIRHPKLHPTRGGVGRCGTGCGDCSAMVPVACYVCHDFQAWVDAPHEEVLNDLLKEQEQWLAETGDERTAFVNHRVILAVSRVIQLCNQIKEAANG